MVFFYDKEHNHAPFADPSVHPQGCALTPAQRQEVIWLASDGLRPTRIVSTMRRQTVSVTPRDVYNLIQAERNRILAGRSPLQALLDKLEGNEAEALISRSLMTNKGSRTCSLSRHQQRKSAASFQREKYG